MIDELGTFKNTDHPKMYSCVCDSLFGRPLLVMDMTNYLLYNILSQVLFPATNTYFMMLLSIMMKKHALTKHYIMMVY